MPLPAPVTTATFERPRRQLRDSPGRGEYQHQPFRHAARLLHVLTFDRDLPRHQEATPATVHRLDDEPTADHGTSVDGSRESHAVKAVVDGHRAVDDLDAMPEHVTNQREQQEPVRDGGFVRRLGGGPQRVYVDPLLVADDLGKVIDALLLHLHPLAHQEFLSNAIREGLDRRLTWWP